LKFSINLALKAKFDPSLYKSADENIKIPFKAAKMGKNGVNLIQIYTAPS
jgi:hypothetical protein